MKLKIFIVLSLVMLDTSLKAQQTDYSKMVNPFIGTGGHGHTYPGACMPFGMVQLSPDTRLSGWDGCSAYHYSDSLIYGFSHTHLNGTGCSDYGDILLMPAINPQGPGRDSRASLFHHTDEEAQPGYYRVRLERWNILAELTATSRTGFHKYIYPGSSGNCVILDMEHRDMVLESQLEIVSSTEIRGMRRSKAWATDQPVYFCIRFSEPFTDVKVYQTDDPSRPTILRDNKAKGNNIKAVFYFGQTKELLIKTGISATGTEGACRNLEAELPGWDFGDACVKARQAWNRELAKIEVHGGTIEQRISFYTALYHCMINPNIFCDADGTYLGRDMKIHKADSLDYYTVFSLWDTYRAEHPLLTIIDRKRTSGFINTFLSQYRQSGRLPVWELWANETNCMIGYHSVSVITDAFMKGIGSFDPSLALQAMKHSAGENYGGLEYYRKYGYVPADKEHESVSKTLEYAYDDWCIAVMARAVGDSLVWKEYLKRAQYYKNLFDPQTGFMRPRINGAWQTPFDPAEVTFHYTEANPWQYSFYVPQDINGLAALYGGKKELTLKLDELFNTDSPLSGRQQADITGLVGQYAHGNEPSHHMVYLFNYLNQPWKTQELSRKIMNTLYSNREDGLCGNEDCGQMSAWYVLSALGIYQVCPGDLQFALGSPLFQKAVIHLENGRDFVIEAPSATDENLYIASATLNGMPYNKCFITYQDIMRGGSLSLAMAASPSSAFGTGEPDVPVSSINAEHLLPCPWVSFSSKTFTSGMSTELFSATPGAIIYYSTDGKDPDRQSRQYEGPLYFDQSTTLKSVAWTPASGYSHITESNFIKINPRHKISLNCKYSSQYTGGGDQALIDGIRGGRNFRLGEWQGYDSIDFVAVLDLGENTMIHKVSAGFLQDIGSWIWMPRTVSFEVSDNGIQFTPLAVIQNSIPDDDYQPMIHDFSAEVKSTGRYIKITAANYGTIPAWHLGAGYTGWIFIDEIMVE